MSVDLIRTTIEQDEKLVVTGTKVWRVVVDDRATQLADSAANMAPVGIGSPYSASYPLSFCKSIKAEPDQDFSYLVTAEYGVFDNQDQQNNPDEPPSPLNEPTQFTFGSNRVEVTPSKDANGKEYCNTAKVPFVEIPTIEVVRPTLTMSKNMMQNASFLIELIGTINSSSALGCKKHTLKITDASSSSQYDQQNGIQYWSVSCTVEFNSDKWIQKIANVGYVELKKDKEGKEKLVAIDSPDPVPLNKDGTKKKAGEEIDYLEFQPNQQAPFSTILRMFDV